MVPGVAMSERDDYVAGRAAILNGLMRRNNLLERKGRRGSITQNAVLERAIDPMNDVFAPGRIQLVDEEELQPCGRHQTPLRRYRRFHCAGAVNDDTASGLERGRNKLGI